MTSETILLSEKVAVRYWISIDWLNLSQRFRYIGTAAEIEDNEMLCGLICELHNEGGCIDYTKKKLTGIGSKESFATLLKSLNLHQRKKEAKIYKEII